ncbi:serine carboxypeptidase-like 51 isoform X2 [Neltuma alba]|uniref:serine carboxypeptidase-like 51 isoform X2 n=1 Tax=Neltuma alba TaxID=207710 RepID=UPI0010A581E3|nr:serine carboxypeptidase-like 51 isoform X2 [Prosopis alba]XP_028776130.1 serine carboxypeptidase-like 51 isoform X2 [Prosopis alba]
MDKQCALIVTSLILGLSFLATTVTALRSHDGLEEWGYVEVRPKAHLFWWLYRSPYRVENPSKPWPIILWLQGGPGASGIGYGNFEEVGPLDVRLKPRNSTWLRKADLLFVDNPVGTGYSYVEHTELLVKTDKEAATDLTTLLIKIFNKNKSLQKSPLYIVGESYGGKFAATLGLSALKAIEAGKLFVKLGGVALGNSWISPEDFVFSWGPLLKDVSRLDDHGLRRSNRIARKIKKQLEDGLFVNATDSWRELEAEIFSSSNYMDIYNFLLDSWEDGSVSLSGTGMSLLKGTGKKRYSKYLSSLRVGDEEIVRLLNGEIKEKLGIIPKNVTWQLQSDAVFDSFEVDFMKPRIDEVDQLLAKGVKVNVYNGQLDVICATKGVEAWLRKLKWEGLPNFLRKERTPLYCGSNKKTKGFVKSYKNLRFYWILGAGHMVPSDQPCMALTMAGGFTDSPAASS